MRLQLHDWRTLRRFLVWLGLLLGGFFSLNGQQIAPIGGQALMLEGTITEYSVFPIKGLTIGSQSEVFTVRVENVVAGSEKSESIRVLHHFYPSELKSESFLDVGSIRRFLLNKLIRSSEFCSESASTGSNLPCYVLQSQNVTTLEDESLLSIKNFLKTSQTSLVIQTAPNLVKQSEVSFLQGKSSKNGRFIFAVNFNAAKLIGLRGDKFVLKKEFPDAGAVDFSSDSRMAVI
jgi:hypothetical protein